MIEHTKWVDPRGWGEE